MIFLYTYILAALIFAIVMVVSSMKSVHFGMQKGTKRVVGLIATFILSFILYPMIIASDVVGDEEYYRERIAGSGINEHENTPS